VELLHACLLCLLPLRSKSSSSETEAEEPCSSERASNCTQGQDAGKGSDPAQERDAAKDLDPEGQEVRGSRDKWRL